MSDSNLASSDWQPGQSWRPQHHTQIASMDPATRAAYGRAAEVNVFGVGFKRDAAGRPIETGIGSEHNQSLQHRAALQIEADRKAALRAAALATPATGLPTDAAALQRQIDELKNQLAALGVAPATASAP
jgi:hypothetical protein